MARMFGWFGSTGYAADIKNLRRGPELFSFLGQRVGEARGGAVGKGWALIISAQEVSEAHPRDRLNVRVGRQFLV